MDKLGLHHCHRIQAPISRGSHLLMDKGRDVPTQILSGGGGERLGIMLSRDFSVSSDVNRGHVSPNHPQ